MAAWQYTFFIVPKSEIEKKYQGMPSSVDENFINESIGWERVAVGTIEAILAKSFGPGRQSSYGPVVFGKEDLSCVKLLFNGSILEEVTVRLDMREEVADQIKDTIKLCKQLDGVIVTTERKTIRDDEDQLISAIKESAAIKFVKDPRRFFDTLDPSK
jgi:hypothetical protein